jgi:hypothetical protein
MSISSYSPNQEEMKTLTDLPALYIIDISNLLPMAPNTNKQMPARHRQDIQKRHDMR